MAEQAPFESALEADIQKLSEQLAELKERHSAETEAGREDVKRTLHGHFYAPQEVPPSQSTKPQSDVSAKTLPDYLSDAPPDVRYQVEKLINFAWHKGIFAAIKEAQKGDPLILDAFHDALTDKLYAEFKDRGHLQ